MFAAENCIATHLDSLEVADLLINCQYGDLLIQKRWSLTVLHDILFYKVGITE
jgi:hypothetical protein